MRSAKASRVASSHVPDVAITPAASPLTVRGASGIWIQTIDLPSGQRDGSSRCGWPTQIVGVSGSMPRSASFADFDTESMPSARWISATSSSPGVFQRIGPSTA